MKEQVSVDNTTHPSTCNCEKYLCPEKFKDYQRLKRLDENIQKQITRLKSWRDSFIKNGALEDEYPVNGFIRDLKLLESLDK